MADYELFVRDGTRAKVGQIDDYSRAQATVRFNATGAWSIDLPASNAIASLLVVPGAGIIVERDGETIISGPVREMKREWALDKDSLTVSGPDDMVYLADRWGSAVPSAAPASYGSAAYDSRVGLAETILRQFVDVNAGPGARAERQVVGLTLATNTLAGISETEAARFDNLLEFLQGVARKGGAIGFRVLQVGLGLQLQCYEPADLTALAVFSADLGNLEGFSYTRVAPTANWVLAAGGGEGTARVFREYGDSASIIRWGRIELFADQRAAADNTALDKAIGDALVQGAEKQTLTLRPRDTDSLAFWTDYRLGDLVSVVVDDEQIRDVVSEVTLDLTPDRGAVVTPVVGPREPSAGTIGGIFNGLRRLNSRLSNLERR